MSSKHISRKLELQLQHGPEGTSSKSTGTDLSMQDIGRLEELQQEIRQLREEVALLEARLGLQERGEPQRVLENVPDVCLVLKTEMQKTCLVRDNQMTPDRRGFKHEPVEMSYCIYSRGLKNLHDLPAVPPQSHRDPDPAEGQDLTERDGDVPQEEQDSEEAVQDLKDTLGPVKTESGPTNEDGEQSNLKVCSGMENVLQHNRTIKEEEEPGGSHKEDYLSSGLAGQLSSGERHRSSASGEHLYNTTRPETLDEDETCSCFWCGEEFPSASVLRTHLSAHERAEGSPACFSTPALISNGSRELVEKLYPCIHCGATFVDLSHCKSHEKSHAGEGPYRCPQCGVSFAFLHSFQNHQKEHSGDQGGAPKPYQCSYCSKQFTTRATLIIHHRTHTGERPYQCCFCDQAFTRSDRLREHERIHTGEKPYQCGSCGKQFSQAASLRTHQRIHTGEKPYRCASCGKQFSDLTGLRTHERQHTGEKPYHCLQCGKSFTQASNLRSHRKVHAAEQASLMFSV